MYLKRVGIINYKSCRDLVIEFYKDIPTVLIGINDSGKTTLLKAIGLLFDSKPNFNVIGIGRTTSDVSNTPLSSEKYKEIFSQFNAPVLPGYEESTMIVGEFLLEREELEGVFLETCSDQMRWAIDSRKGNTILLLRMFNNDNPGGRYFICLGDNTSLKELWTKKDKELQALRKAEGIETDEIQNDNRQGRFSTFEIIRALYNKVGFETVWAEAPTFPKEDLPLFPEYRYIDWNTSLTDLTKLANDVMRDRIDGQKAKLTHEATNLSIQATQEVNDEFEKLTKDLTLDLPNISCIKAQVSFTVSESISDIVINKITGDGDIKLDSQGEGIKRQIVFAFLKWASKQKIAAGNTKKSLIWCFDEPEAHLYPAAQRDLFKIINDLSKTNFQIIVGTHSTVFVDRSKIGNLKKIVLADKYTKLLSCECIQDVHSALGIRNSDILFFNKFLAVEGDSEVILIPHFYKIYFGRTLDEDSVKLISLGGIGAYKANRDMFEKLLNDFKLQESMVHYIFDADTCETGSNVSLLGACDLEDLLPDSVWMRVVKERCGLDWGLERFSALRGQLDKTNTNRKYHKLLGSEVAKDMLRTDFLPSKRECALLLAQMLTEIEHIPEPVQIIFKENLSSY